MKEALKLALEALQWSKPHKDAVITHSEAITAIVAALAQPAPVQEPVAGQPLPCPFCGHIGLDFGDGETYRWGIASCGGCGASCMDVRREYPDQGKWHTEAIAEWNKRSPAAQPAQEPITVLTSAGYIADEDDDIQVYQRPWVGLTTEEISNELISDEPDYVQGFVEGTRWAEAKLKEKNG
jgi:hypothetical protein